PSMRSARSSPPQSMPCPSAALPSTRRQRARVCGSDGVGIAGSGRIRERVSLGRTSCGLCFLFPTRNTRHEAEGKANEAVSERPASEDFGHGGVEAGDEGG